MRVAIVTMQFPSSSETFATNDILELHRQGVDLEVFCLKLRSKKHEQMVYERNLQDIKIHVIEPFMMIQCFFSIFLQPNQFLFCLKKIFYCLDSIFKLGTYKQLLLVPFIIFQYKHIVKSKFDIVHLFWGHYPSYIGLLLKKFNPQYKVSLFLGAYDLEMLIDASIQLLKQADIVLTHSFGNVHKLKEHTKSDVNVIYRGINSNNIDAIKSELPKRKHVVGTPFVITSIGRLVVDKGFKDVLLAFQEIQHVIPNAQLNILGDGPERETLEKLVDKLGLSKMVKFYGHVDHRTALINIYQADLFLFMSKSDDERLPNVVKEAMALETICISTKTTDMEELLEDKVEGYLVELGDYRMASKYAIDVYSDIGLSNKDLKNNAVKKIEQNFLSSVSISKTIDIWNKIFW